MGHTKFGRVGWLNIVQVRMKYGCRVSPNKNILLHSTESSVLCNLFIIL